MQLLLILSLLSTTEGFAPISTNTLTSSPHGNLIKTNTNRCRQPFNLCSVRDDTSLEETARITFDTYCNDDKLMGLSDLKCVPFVQDLLKEGDLLESELNEIYSTAATGDAINIEGFIAVYKDIDNLFEDEEEDESDNDISDDDSELKVTFANLSTDGMVSKSQLRKWEEIESLIDDEGILGIEEFDELWKKSVSNSDMMDFESFAAFNEALDDLFVLEDDEMEDAVEEEVSARETPLATSKPKPIITEIDLPPAVLFSQLADENYLVSKQDILSRWGELREMLSDGDLSSGEFNDLWNGLDKAPGTGDKLDEESFLMMYDKIDELFEDEVEAEQTTNVSVTAKDEQDMQDLKEELLDLIDDLEKLAEGEGRQPCGLDCTELEQERVLEVVGELEREPCNRVLGGEAVPKEDLVGSWDLIYSSSSTMKYNEGLSGLAGGLTKFGGVQQNLSATKYLSDVEYVEQVVGKLGGQSFEVRITGDWDLRTEVSLFTGKPSNVLSVTPDSVKYGPRSDKADHWKSLGPLNSLTLSYLDDNLRIMRGNTSTDTLFIFRRCK